MIIAQIASIPDREQMLYKTVTSLRSQVNAIFVGLNNYDHKPIFLNDDECKFFDNSLGDAVKFYNVENLKGYIFTCDDDLIYPKNYVKTMIEGIKKHHSIVTLHGKVYGFPIEEFNRCKSVYRCLDAVFGDGRVDVGGTGVMAWHSDDFKPKYREFRSANMADLWLAKQAHEQNVKIMCLGHEAGWIKYQQPTNTIWESGKKTKFREQTKLLKSFIK